MNTIPSQFPQPTPGTIKALPLGASEVTELLVRIIHRFNQNGLELISAQRPPFTRGDNENVANFIASLFEFEIRRNTPTDQLNENKPDFGFNYYLATILSEQIIMESSGDPQAIGGETSSSYGLSYGLLQVSAIFIPKFVELGYLPAGYRPNFMHTYIPSAYFESVQLWLCWMALNPLAMIMLWQGRAYSYGLIYNGGPSYARELNAYFSSKYPQIG